MKLFKALTVAGALALSANAQAALFQESFDTDTADNAQTQAAYPDFTLTGGGSPIARVTGGQLFIDQTGNNTQAFTRPGEAGDTRFSGDISASNSNGGYNVGLAVGTNRIVFHPGFAGAAFRVEGPNGFGNTNIGFTPTNGTMHHIDIDTFSQLSLFRATFTDGNTAQTFTTSYISPTAVGGAVGAARGGPANGDSRFDNLALTGPKLTLNNLVSESFDTPAAGTAAFNIAYPQITTTLNGGAVSASGGRAIVSGSGADTPQLLTLGNFTGEYVVQAQVGGDSNPGGWNTGISIGENNIVFHPGFTGGAFRVEGPGGFGNTAVGFNPALNELHTLTIHSLGDGTFVVFLQNALDPNQIFRTTFTNVASIDAAVSLRRAGPTSGQALFGSVNVYQVDAVTVVPEPATMSLLVLAGAAAMLRRRRA